ncbi:DUF1702 family protein [Sinosporangium siamense]|uniref:Enediyne biosynthesis protein n=1 Tax=Sinosporangium siamense TaxID=1367973 RepID=A0A919RIM9_9ACTN|nr:DUF1702 family protein [Sinosporangium siamense]GII92559.1 enediyne biosynthesis protein [Sinosporangium siamense]
MGSTDTMQTGTDAEEVRTPPDGPPGKSLRGFLTQDLGQMDFALRRFGLLPAEARAGLEEAGRSFLIGFNAMLSRRLDTIGGLREDLRGFAFEGAGMGAAMLDLLKLTGGRHLRELLNGPALAYPHLVHVGVGWAYARLRARPMWGITTAHPLLRWLALDGFGFHRGFFSADSAVGARREPRPMRRGHRAVVDQGLGRMLWFHECANPDGVAARVAEFPPGRRADLWSGVGMAAAYTGQCDGEGLAGLAAHASRDGYRAHLAQGAAFACAAHLRSGIMPPHTEAAAPLLCGVEADEAGAWTDESLAGLGTNPRTYYHYQSWRAGIRKSWACRNKGRLDI